MEEQAKRKIGSKVPGLRRARESALLSQEELHEKSGVGRATIARAELGSDVYLSTVRRLARALKVRPERLTTDGQTTE